MSGRDLDVQFHDAVAAIDSGDVGTLERLLTEDPRLVRDRLAKPGSWLCDKVGRALKNSSTTRCGSCRGRGSPRSAASSSS